MAGLPGSPASLLPAGPDEMVRRMRDLERSLSELGPSVARSFAPVILDLQTKQAALDAQLVSINALIGQQIYPTFGKAVASGFAIPATQAGRVTVASLVLTVPSGYTRALINATSPATGINSTAVSDYLYSYVQIGASDFSFTPSPTTPPSYSATASTTTTSLVTGLTGGGSVTILTQPYAGAGAWAASAGSSAVISAICLFLR